MIIISPYSRILGNNKPNPKNYPYWKELVSMIDEPIVQIGVVGDYQLVSDFRLNLSLDKLSDLVKECRTWISVDSFFQHFCWDLNKPGVVLWGPSDPLIFGHPENINLLKSRNYLLEQQFFKWDMVEYSSECFVEPSVVVDNLRLFKKSRSHKYI